MAGCLVLGFSDALDGWTKSARYECSRNQSAFTDRWGKTSRKVSWQDIFRYGFSVHSSQYGKLFKAANYDRFLPSEATLAIIQNLSD